MEPRVGFNTVEFEPPRGGFNTVLFEPRVGFNMEFEQSMVTDNVREMGELPMIFQYEAVPSFPELSELAKEMEMTRVGELMGLVCPFQQLEMLLGTVYEQLQPTENDRMARVSILGCLSNLVTYVDACKDASVLPFGSFESTLYTPWGDLDISLVLPTETIATVSRSKRLRILKAVRQSLFQTGGFFNIQLVSQARVPLLSFVDRYSNVACDLSVCNTAAVIKSHVMGWLTRMDMRCRELIFLVKCWAKAQCINDPKLGTLNSYALSQLVIFHLQTRDPPILPPLSAVFSEGVGVGDSLKYCLLKIQALTDQGFGRNNTSSVAQLFLSFFTQFTAVADLWQGGLAVSTYHGRWCDKNTTDRTWDKKGYVMLVEDPFDLSDNCARTVHEGSFKLICKAFKLTVETLYNKGFYVYPSVLRERLFQWPTTSPRPLHNNLRPGIPELEEYVSPGGWKQKAKAKKAETVAKRTAVKRSNFYVKSEASSEMTQQVVNGVAAVSLGQTGNGTETTNRGERTEQDEVLHAVRGLFRPPPPPRRRHWIRQKPQWHPRSTEQDTLPPGSASS